MVTHLDDIFSLTPLQRNQIPRCKNQCDQPLTHFGQAGLADAVEEFETYALDAAESLQKVDEIIQNFLDTFSRVGGTLRDSEKPIGGKKK